MKCQKCNQHEATTHITQIINGHKTEMYLCRECAEGNKDFINFKSGFDTEFDNLLGGFWGGMPKISVNTSVKKCDICGMTQNHFIKSGKPGCSNCYNVFQDLLLRPLKQIHGSTRHTGKIPERSGRDIRTADKIEELQTRLNRAIMEQNFEEAAVLRDEINELKSNQQKGEI